MLFPALAGATHAFLVPALIASVLAAGEKAIAALSGLKVIAYGASPIPLPLMQQTLAAWPETDFLQVYGMTEMSGVVSILSPSAHRDTSHPERLLSAGQVLPGIELRIVDPESGDDVPAGAAGEVLLRSDQAMAGYPGKPEATAAAITDDGWLRSGDVGRAEDGFLYLEDRVKDMIITGGENVYSPEVERVLVDHPAIAEVAVIGVPDDHWGESVKAIVVPAPGAELDEAAVIDYCRERLAHYKCPRSLDVVEALPRNSTGKVLKRELREPYWRGRERQL